MPVETTTVGVKIGVELLKRAVPHGIVWIVNWIRGNRILVVGQPRAGKTSFLNLLQYGVFASPDISSPRTRKDTKSASFQVKVGDNQALQLAVRTTIDTVGQVSALDHAQLD